MLARATVLVPVGLGVVVIDQVTKWIIRDRVEVGASPLDVIPLVQIEHVENRGVAFSIFADRPWLVLVLALVVLAVMVGWASRVDDRFTLVGIGTVVGGAVGNIIDRVGRGHVTDFIRLPHWPTFNVADIAICIGVVIILLSQWRGERTEAEVGGADAG